MLLAFYPNGVEESFRLTVDAFNAAEESRSPVVVLSTPSSRISTRSLTSTRSLSWSRLSSAGSAARIVHRRARFFAGVPMYEHGPNAASRRPPTPTSTCASSTRPSTATSRSPRATRSSSTAGDRCRRADRLLRHLSRVVAPLRDQFASSGRSGSSDAHRTSSGPSPWAIARRLSSGKPRPVADLVELALHRRSSGSLLGGRISLEAVPGNRSGARRWPSEPPIRRSPRSPSPSIAGSGPTPEAPLAELTYKDRLKLELFPTIWSRAAASA